MGKGFQLGKAIKTLRKLLEVDQRRHLAVDYSEFLEKLGKLEREVREKNE